MLRSHAFRLTSHKLPAIDSEFAFMRASFMLRSHISLFARKGFSHGAQQPRFHPSTQSGDENVAARGRNACAMAYATLRFSIGPPSHQ
jgi:hypothetical protein